MVSVSRGGSGYQSGFEVAVELCLGVVSVSRGGSGYQSGFEVAVSPCGVGVGMWFRVSG